MRVFAQGFWLPKKGNGAHEYEDAFWPRRLPVDGAEVLHFRVAVADGATETSFSRFWARMLVRSYVKGQLFSDRSGAPVKKLQDKWQRSVSQRPLPWYAREKARGGAAAALLGLHIHDVNAKSEGPGWEAVAIGDCCLFQVRGAQVVEYFPIRDANEFSNRPFLLSSNWDASEEWRAHLKMISGYWRPDDSFYLMSDALAAWFMRSNERAGSPWKILRDLGTTESLAFPEWIGGLRTEQHIRNDDVTLLRIDLVT